tara:strand:- start:544 stop:741 length:198 start_codon:yes stop_codon:yes gene_type:complete
MVKQEESESKMERLKYELEVLKERVADYEDQISQRIEDNPIASVSASFGIGAAVGVLIGFLIGKK